MGTDRSAADVDPTVLLFETAPDGGLDALVQHDGRTIYLYLNDRAGEFGTRACWVRNLIEAPLEISQKDLNSGRPPLLPRFVVNHPKGLPLPSTGQLQLVWFEEGNGIALFEGDSVVAVIPPWSGEEGFHGYARDCLAENEVCWPLPNRPALAKRIRRAAEFWQQCQTTQPLDEIHRQLSRTYRERFGEQTQVFAVGQGAWPPLAIHCFRGDDQLTLVSAGMSLRPQPNVELEHDAPGSVRRIELAMRMPADARDPMLAERIEILASQIRFPWRRWTWLRHGQVIRWQLEGRAPAHWLFFAEPKDRGTVGRFRDDPIRLLWSAPIDDADAEPAEARFDELVLACRQSGRLPA